MKKKPQKNSRMAPKKSNTVAQPAHTSRLELLDFKKYRWYELVVLAPMLLVAIQAGLVGKVLGLVGIELALRYLRHQGWALSLRIMFALGVTAVYISIYGLLIYLVVDWARTVLAGS